MHRGAKSLDADAVHDLRVTIRRFTQSLRVFASLLPQRQARKVRKRLRRLMTAAGQVRDRDIALGFLDKAGWPARSPIRARLARERKEQGQALAELLKRWNKRNFSVKWRSSLQLDLS